MRIKASAVARNPGIPPAAMICLLIATGCMDEPVSTDEWPRDLHVPVRQIQLLVDGLGGDYLTIGTPMVVTDGFGQPREVLPIYSDPVLPSENTAFWDYQAARFVRTETEFGTSFGWAPHHDLMPSFSPVPMMLMLGLRFAGLVPENGTRFFTESGEWDVYVEPATGGHLQILKGRSAPFIGTEIHVTFREGEQIPASVVVPRWGLPVALPGQRGIGSIAGAQVQKVNPAESTVAVQLDRPAPRNASLSVSDLQPLVAYGEGAAQFWGPPSKVDGLPPFSLNEALSAIAANGIVADFAEENPNSYVLYAGRTRLPNGAGVGTDFAWNILLGNECTSPPSRGALRVIVRKPVEPLVLAAYVDSSSSAECWDMPNFPGSYSSWDSLPKSMVVLDDALSLAANALGKKIGPEVALHFNAALSCVPDSAYGIQLAIADKNLGSVMVSQANGQTLFTSSHSFAPVLECRDATPP